MKKLESDYLDGYKELDALCARRLSHKNGVSEYLTRMEAAPARARGRVPGWEADYKLLKHLRWVRNQIAHDPGTSPCTQEDRKSLEDFRRRMVRNRDPLSLLQSRGKTKSAGGDRTSPPFPLLLALAILLVLAALLLRRLLPSG